MLAFSLLVAALAAPPCARPADGPATSPVPPAAAAPVSTTEDARFRRALALLAGSAEDRVRLVRAAADGPADERRAALDALARLAPGTALDGALEAALGALASGDPLLRRAGVRALLASGDAAGAALERLAGGTGGGIPAWRALVCGLLRARAKDALFDLQRAAVERDFLASWLPDDGTFHGMFADLRKHGAFGAKVLAAIALDRRVAAGDVLGYGPYAWFAPTAGERDRSDCRYRALEALADAGDAAAREMLRTSLRRRVVRTGEIVEIADDPARELFDENDPNPIPAPLDDALREAIAALGDPGPLNLMIELSAATRHSPWEYTVEMRRRAGAKAVLASAAANPVVREQYLAEAERLLRGSMARKDQFGIPRDGVEYYNLACLLARRDGPADAWGDGPSRSEVGVDERPLPDRSVALLYLRRSLDTHAVSSAWLVKDGDLRSLRDEPEFKALLARLREKERALEKGLPGR